MLSVRVDKRPSQGLSSDMRAFRNESHCTSDIEGIRIYWREQPAGGG